MRVKLPDGTVLEVAEGATTADVAGEIGPGLARVAVAGRVTHDGTDEVYDLGRPLPEDCALKILTAKDPDALRSAGLRSRLPGTPAH